MLAYMKALTALLAIACILASPAIAKDLEIQPVTSVNVKDGTITARSIPMNSASNGFYIVRIPVNKTGSIKLTGTAKYKGEGSINLVMWSMVEGNDHFSKMPTLQGFSSKEGKKFEIPFHAQDKTITEIKLAVNFLSAEGVIELSDLKLESQDK